ncbi:hypothetical protein [Promicromonospora sukumoe]|uniref:hypothetical protein n=1 Tax=Promicromonospora sukumoe TaxID=88382 RepID=UPI00037759DB|nr:hypothetical protein [Promicromonospora sukumoe]
MRTSAKVTLGALAALVLLVAVAVGSWSIRGAQANSADQAAAAAIAAADDVRVGVPTVVSAEALEEFSADHYPLYWAGEIPDTQIELTHTASSGTFVRYIPEGKKAGDSDKYLTVATYDAITGYEGLKSADKDLATVEKSKSGAVIAVFDDRPLSTYFSFQNAAFQVEVFSPEKNESKKLTDDGSISLVGGETR